MVQWWPISERDSFKLQPSHSKGDLKRLGTTFLALLALFGPVEYVFSSDLSGVFFVQYSRYGPQAALLQADYKPNARRASSSPIDKWRATQLGRRCCCCVGAMGAVGAGAAVGGAC